MDDGSKSNNIVNLKRDLSVVQLVPGDDQWRYAINTNGPFNVYALRKKLDQLLYPNRAPSDFRWNKVSLVKVNCFIWRALQKKIPSAVVLRVKELTLITRIVELVLTVLNVQTTFSSRALMHASPGRKYSYGVV